MAFFEFPHTRIYDSDLGWLIKNFAKIAENMDTLTKWKAEHQEEYADLLNKVNALIDNLVDVISPWNSELAYRIYDVVSYLGTNYIAIQDVPVGIMITNEEYWQPANTFVEQLNAIGVTVSEFLEAFKNFAEDKTYTYEINSKNITVKDLKRSSFAPVGGYGLSISETLGSYSGYILQSACETNDGFVLGFSKSTTYDDSVIVKLDNDFNVAGRYNLDLGHCNDIAYDGTYLYVATMATGNNANSIVKIIYNTMTVADVIEIGTPVYQISYDENNNIFYYNTYGNSAADKLVITDDTFNILAEYIINDYFDNENIIYQGSTIINGNFLLQGGIFGDPDLSHAGWFLRQAKPDGELGNMYAFNTSVLDEAEGLAVKNNILYCFSFSTTQDTIYIYKYSLDYDSSNGLNYASIGRGNFLASGNNLNYLPNGIFSKLSGAINIENWPGMPTGGTLFQFTSGVDHTVQICVCTGVTTVDIYRREFVNNVWSDWAPLSATNLYANPLYCVGYVTNAATEIYIQIPFPTYPIAQTYISNGKITVRGVAGYVIPLDTNVSNYNVSYEQSGRNGLLAIKITNKDGSAFSVTNNTPVVATILPIT